MKIAFVTPYYDPRDVRRGSGTFYYMSRELERQGCTLSYFGPVVFREPEVVRPLRAFTRKIQKKRYLTYLDPAVARALGAELSRQLRGKDFDLVLTNDPGAAAGLDVSMPVVYYSDVMLPASPKPAALRQLIAYRQVPLWALRRYQRTMRRCLDRSALAVFPAPWQLEQAKGYGVDPKKLRQISFGANIPDPGPVAAEYREFSLQASQKKISLLFVGREWFDKGGDVAIAVVEELRAGGVDAVLHVVGVNLPNSAPYVHCYGYLRKNHPREFELLERLYRECDCLVFPSQHEGSAITPREAAAYGLPTLAYRIEGLLSSVVDGQSGLLLEPGAGPQGFAEIIKGWFENPVSYQRLSLGARAFYESYANWAGVVSKLIRELDPLSKNAQA